MPKISIIVPNYNTEKYLSRCIDSLVNQTFQDIEIILIDDGSKDNSVQIMKKYAAQDKRIKVIEQTNAGPAIARNRGLEMASGKYLMFCDSDDWYEPNMCQVMYDTIEKQRVDVVCCHNFFDWEENLNTDEKEERLVEKYYNPNKFGKYILRDRCILSTNVLLWNKIWRRDIVEKYQIRFPKVNAHEDDAFWYMYAMVANNIYYLKQPLYHYFLCFGSIMSTQANKKPKNRMDRIAISDYVCEFLLQNKLTEYTNMMVDIYRGELSGCRQFFNEIELVQLCLDTTKKIHQKLSVNKEIITCNGFIFYSSHTKNLLQLYLEFLYYRICFYFWFLFKNEKKKNSFYKKISKNLADFRRRKGSI